MKNLFNLVNPIFQMLSRVGDMIIANVLFLISCIPIFTIGAALAGLNKVSQAIVLDDDRGISNLFFNGFKSNFKQATSVWVAILIILVSLVCNWLLITTFVTGTFATVLYVLLGILVFLVIGVLSYLIPLIVRYNNTIREHLYNAIILAIMKFPRTLVMVFLNIVLFILPFISLNAFSQTMIFWLMIGFSFLSYIISTLLKPVFKELEGETSTIA